MGKKRKNEDDYNEYDLAPKHLQVAHMKNQEKRLIVILENAQLESVKVSSSMVIKRINFFTVIIGIQHFVCSENRSEMTTSY